MGSVTVTDLARSADVEQVVIVDADAERAAQLAASFADPRVVARAPSSPLENTLLGMDATVNAAGHAHNLRVMRACLAAGSHYTDLGGLFHVALEQYSLHEEFAAAELTATLSMGSAPGLTNMLAARAIEMTGMDAVESIEIADAVVPGRPFHPSDSYAPPYAAATLIEEYTAPAPQFLDGEIRYQPAGSGARTYDFPGGSVECIYTIHSEPATLPKSYADRGIARVEWRLGLAPADHVRLLSFVAAGLASTEPVNVDGRAISPAEVLAAALSRQVREGHGVPDPDAVEWFRVITAGRSGGRSCRVTSDVQVTDPAGIDIPGGAWVTGVPPSIAAQIMARGDALRTGVHGPELAIPVPEFFAELAGRGMLPIDTIDA